MLEYQVGLDSVPQHHPAHLTLEDKLQEDKLGAPAFAWVFTAPGTMGHCGKSSLSEHVNEINSDRL